MNAQENKAAPWGICFSVASCGWQWTIPTYKQYFCLANKCSYVRRSPHIENSVLVSVGHCKDCHEMQLVFSRACNSQNALDLDVFTMSWALRSSSGVCSCGDASQPHSIPLKFSLSNLWGSKCFLNLTILQHT